MPKNKVNSPVFVYNDSHLFIFFNYLSNINKTNSERNSSIKSSSAQSIHEFLSAPTVLSHGDRTFV